MSMLSYSWRHVRKTVALPLLVLMGSSASCVVGIFDEDGALRDNRFEASASFAYDVPVLNKTRIHVAAVSGFIELRTAPGLDQISIIGRRIVGAESRSEAQRRLDDLQVDVVESQGEVVVRTEQPSRTDGRRYEVEYEISVPDNFRVDFDQTNGLIDLSGPLADADVANVNGTVTVRGTSGPIDVSVVNGNVDADMPQVAGDLEVATTNGNVSLRIPSASSATLSAQVVNGSITISGLALTDQVVTQRSLRGTLGGAQHSIELTTVNGNVAISGN